MLPPSSHELFQWTWHHFRPLAEAKNYLPILDVLANHEGSSVQTARSAINEEVARLQLEVGLGKRKSQRHADIFRDRIDVWRFTGALYEPGLVGDRIQLTELGHALLSGAPFDKAMTRQALRLSFPRVVRIRDSARLGKAVDRLKEALAIGPGVNALRAWATASGHLRVLEETSSISGEEASKFLSGATKLDEVPDRAEALRMERIGVPSGYPEPPAGGRRQGSEIRHWFEANGVLAPINQNAVALDPSDRYFVFEDGSVDEMMRWSRWWGSWPQL